MQKETLDTLNKFKEAYVFCGMVKLHTGDGLYYVGSGNITGDLEEEFEVTINSMADFVPVRQWLPEDCADAIDGELENQGHHSYKITPHKVLSAMPKSVTDVEKIEILKTLYDWLIS